MAKPIAQRGTAMMQIPEAHDTYRVPQRDVFWSPFKGMNTTLPKNLLERDTLQWAENVIGWYGSAMTRPGVRHVGGSALADGAINTIVEFITSDGISYLLRMGLLGFQFFDGTNWIDVPGYTPPASMTVFDKFATTAFADMLIFSDGISGMYKYDPAVGNIVLIDGAPSARHLSTFASRVVASYIIELSGLAHPTRVQWSVKNNSDDWAGIGSGYEDMLSTPGGFIDEQMGVYPLDDYKALAVRSNSVWSMAASGNVEAPFVFERRFAGLGSKHRHSIVPVPGGIIGFMTDLSVYFITDSSVEPIGDPIRDARYSRNGLRISRDSGFGDLLAVGAYSGKQRKYVIVLSTRTAPNGAQTGGFTSVMYQCDLSTKAWTRLAWPEASLHWVVFSSGTKVGLTIDTSPGNIEDAGTSSIESEVGDIALGQRDVLVAASNYYLYREDYTLYSDNTTEFGAQPITQSLVSGQLVATTPLNRVEMSGFRLIYMSSVTGVLTLRIHIWDSGAEQTIDMQLPIQKSMDSNDAVIQGSRMAYAPVRAEGYNIEFELINALSGRVIIEAAAPEIKGTPDIVAGYGTTAMP